MKTKCFSIHNYNEFVSTTKSLKHKLDFDFTKNLSRYMRIKVFILRWRSPNVSGIRDGVQAFDMLIECYAFKGTKGYFGPGEIEF